MNTTEHVVNFVRNFAVFLAVALLVSFLLAKVNRVTTKQYWRASALVALVISMFISAYQLQFVQTYDQLVTPMSRFIVYWAANFTSMLLVSTVVYLAIANLHRVSRRAYWAVAIPIALATPYGALALGLQINLPLRVIGFASNFVFLLVVAVLVSYVIARARKVSVKHYWNWTILIPLLLSAVANLR